jgi:hypothetical protein
MYAVCILSEALGGFHLLHFAPAGLFTQSPRVITQLGWKPLNIFSDI